MKLSTIQKRNNLNIVERMGSAGPGGAYHNYDVCTVATPEEESSRVAVIAFQCGARKEPGSTRGVLDVDLLEIVRDRLTCFQQGDFATRENAVALTHIEEALMWMNKRVEDRAERGVLGTTNK
jgi:hypothetical protein